MIAALHIIGATITFLLLSTILYLFGSWIDRTNARRALEEASLDLAVPFSELFAPSFEQGLNRYFGAKYSNDLLKNRVSDFIGVLLAVLNWVTLLLELAILALVTWLTVTDSQADAVYAWLILAIPVAASAIGLGTYFLCKLITGRFPSQARHIRKIIAQSINRISESVA